MKRPLKFYLLIICLILCLGLPTRMIRESLPLWYVDYAGDALWAMMVFFLFALIFRRSTCWVLLVTLVFTYLIEFFQLYHAPWIDGLREMKLFGLILGYGFLWTDLIAYTVGVVVAAGVDWAILLKRSKSSA